MALVQPMMKALRENNKKEIDRYEDITEILVNDVTSDIRTRQTTEAKQPASRAFERTRNEVLEYFVKLRKSPEKVEQFIEQAYRETKSTDFAVITERVYDLLRMDADGTKNEEHAGSQESLLKGKDHTAMLQAGVVDDEKW